MARTREKGPQEKNRPSKEYACFMARPFVMSFSFYPTTLSRSVAQKTDSASCARFFFVCDFFV
jgi:hypothetical protein